ncbi:uncharacterized protein LOC113557592 [Rhopalosiphum maidis]|uniref:uncharacterized protein LOC113557592 n=1 Tax=Rhopalosiphum maidis TaxID=43146 RepID=UPI000EFFE553|nr:uncharacterized protein LOC113557592 [Rhopalosiphum maidis]
MDSSSTKKTVTASGVSETPEPAVGGRCSPQVSSSPVSTKSVEVLRQASTASNGAGRATAGGSAKQALSSGRKATEDTVGSTGAGSMSIPDGWKNLRGCLKAQDGDLKLLTAKARDLELWSVKVRSIEAKAAIEGVLLAVAAIGSVREAVAKAANAMTKAVNDGGQSRSGGAAAGMTGVCSSSQTIAIGTNPVKRVCAGTQTTDQAQQKPQQRQRQRQQQQQQPQQKPQQQQQQQQQQQPPNTRKRRRRGPQGSEQPTWSQVVQRGKRKSPSRPKAQPSPATEKISLLRQRAPRTAAVTIDRPAEGGSLAAVMKRVSGSVSLASLGVKVVTTRRTKAGGILLEVEGEEKARILERRIREVVGEAARVRRPERKTPVLLLDVPEWVEVEDVVGGLGAAGVVVAAPDVDRISIRKNGGSRGDRVARVDLPFRDAIALAEAKVVVVGWTRCRVKLLEKKQTTCFRCQQKGHLAAECRNAAKPRACYRCGATSHLSRGCSEGRRGSGGPSSVVGGSNSGGTTVAVEEGPAEMQPVAEESSQRLAGRPASRSASASSSEPQP